MADKTVGGLYLSLGLDISELEAGFAVADRTMNQALARFNSDAAQIKLKADIDTANATSAVEKLNIQYKALGDQIEIARKKELLLMRDMEASRNSLGADNPLTRKAETALLKQQRATALLAQKQRELKGVIDTSAGSMFRFSDALQASQGGI
ncbi:MAG: hypothetical protein IJ521_00315, partial [Schwartzia sp.]|nr:hypothetical protein [Schwartzia sp. (in: firmicutes)]